jgi:hypothetical protein
VYAGLAQQSGAVTVSGFPASSYHTKDSGVALGIDFQIQASPNTSLSAFYEAMNSTGYTCSGCGSGNEVGNTAYGLEARYWLGRVFLGFRSAEYSESFHTTGPGGRTTTGSGTGVGLTFGVEGSSGVFVKAAFDQYDVKLDNTFASQSQSDSVKTSRVFLGFRF